MRDIEQFDILIIGSGESGKYLAWTLAKTGHRTALIERKMVGGTSRLCTKSGKSDLFSLRPLRISAALCVERPINAENAEIRRGPQRKDFHLDSTFCAKPARALTLPVCRART